MALPQTTGCSCLPMCGKICRWSAPKVPTTRGTLQVAVGKLQGDCLGGTKASRRELSLICVFTCTGTLSDYQFMRRHTGSAKRAEKAKEAWGTSLNSLQDVCKVFTKYTSGMHATLIASNQTRHWHNVQQSLH